MPSIEEEEECRGAKADRSEPAHRRAGSQASSRQDVRRRGHVERRASSTTCYALAERVVNSGNFERDRDLHPFTVTRAEVYTGASGQLRHLAREGWG